MKHYHNNTKESLNAIIVHLVTCKINYEQVDIKHLLSRIQKKHKPVYHRFAIWLLSRYRDALHDRGYISIEKYSSINAVIAAHEHCASGGKVGTKQFARIRKKAQISSQDASVTCFASITSLVNLSNRVEIFIGVDEQISKLSEIIQERLHHT